MAGAVLVTGAGRRIGGALARALAGEGRPVALHYMQSRDAALALAGEIARAGGRAVALQADLGCREQTASLFERAAEALGPVTALVNNASIFEPDRVGGPDAGLRARHMRINLEAPLELMEALARALPDDAQGAVVNMLDHKLLKLNPDYVSYTLSKAGLWTLTRIYAQGLAPRIRVNAVGPGPVLPNAWQDVRLFDAEAAALPLGRAPSVADIVDAVRYLLAASSVTGQMIAVDGGQHLAWDTPDLRAGRGE